MYNRFIKTIFSCFYRKEYASYRYLTYFRDEYYLRDEVLPPERDEPELKSERDDEFDEPEDLERKFDEPLLHERLLLLDELLRTVLDDERKLLVPLLKLLDEPRFVELLFSARVTRFMPLLPVVRLFKPTDVVPYVLFDVGEV